MTTTTVTLGPLFTWRGAICDSGLPPAARSVAWVLALHMSERDNVAWPSVSTLAHETGLCERSVQKQLRRLEEEGWIVTESGRKGGRGRTTRYVAVLPKGVPNPYLVPVPDPQKGAPDAPFSDPQKGAPDAPFSQTAAKKGAPRAPFSPEKDVTTARVSKEIIITTRSSPKTARVSTRRSLTSRNSKNTLAPSALFDDATSTANGNGRSQRPRDLLWEALIEHCGYDPTKITPSARGALNRAVKEIREAGGDPEQIREAAQAFRRRFPRAPLTASALAKHWPTLLRPAVGELVDDGYGNLIRLS